MRFINKRKMKIGFIGLGRMGRNMVLNLIEHAHEVVVYNRTPKVTKEFIKETNKALASFSIEELIEKLPKQKIIWLMIKAGKPIDDTISSLLPHITKEDIIIDGGNSYFKDSIRRFNLLEKKGVHFLDIGTSGGIEGARKGACMMIGGEKSVFKWIEKLFKDLCVKNGYGYMGKTGSGHFVKMVHNSIEYGMMSSIGEGLNTIKKYEKKFGININEVTKVYSHGSIIEGKLMKWVDQGLKRPYFKKIKGSVPKGETEEEMKKLSKLLEMPVLKQAVKEREITRKKPSYAGKIISVIRNEFGGHTFEKS